MRRTGVSKCKLHWGSFEAVGDEAREGGPGGGPAA
jgi:hypothetical protein